MENETKHTALQKEIWQIEHELKLSKKIILQKSEENEKLKEKYADLKNLLNQIVEKSAEGIAIFHFGNLHYVSPNLLRMFNIENLTAANITSDFIFSHVHPDDLEYVTAETTKAQKEKIGDYKYQFRCRFPNGKYRWVENSIKNNFDECGKNNQSFVSFRDIHEKKEMEIQLAESEKNLKKVLEAIVDPIFIQGAKNQFVLVNQAAAESLEYSKEELSQMGVMDVEASLTKPQLAKILETINREKKILFEGCHKTKTGKIFPVEIHSSQIEYNGEKVIISVARNISRRKQTEKELQKSKIALQNELNFSQTLIKHLPLPLFYKDKDGKYLGCNPEFENFIGIKEENLKGKTVFDMWNEELATVYMNHDNELLENPKHQSYEFEVKDVHGKKRAVIFHKAVYKDENNNPKGIIGVYLDISDRKKAEKSMEESQRNLKLFIDSSPDMFFLKDSNLNYLIVNKAFAEFLKNSEDKIKGKYDIQILPKQIAQIFKKSDTKVIQNKLPIINIETIDNKIFEVRKNPIIENNEIIGIAGIIRDITEMQKAEAALIESEKQLKELNTTKDKFFSIIAHDLKNPFNSLIGYSELIIRNIKKGNWSKIEGFAQTILESAELGAKLLQNLLDWSRAQTGKIRFNPINIELHDLINDVISLHSAAAKQKEIQFLFDTNQKQKISGDYNMIYTIIRNVISNAIKYSDSGDIITIKLYCDEKLIHIEVIDTGIGIKKENLNKIFNIEYNFSTEGTNREKGTGLGLSLCYEFIKQHNGNITIESVFGKGTTVKIELPIENAGK